MPQFLTIHLSPKSHFSVNLSDLIYLIASSSDISSEKFTYSHITSDGLVIKVNYLQLTDIQLKEIENNIRLFYSTDLFNFEGIDCKFSYFFEHKFYTKYYD